jgi:hypothetical protein
VTASAEGWESVPGSSPLPDDIPWLSRVSRDAYASVCFYRTISRSDFADEPTRRASVDDAKARAVKAWYAPGSKFQMMAPGPPRIHFEATPGDDILILVVLDETINAMRKEKAVTPIRTVSP